MTYSTDDKTVSGSRPIDLYTFEGPLTTFYLTTFNRDVVAQRWDDPLTNVTYVATKGLGRTSLPTTQVNGNMEVSVQLPFEHPLAQLMIPGTRTMPQYLKCTIMRQQQVSAELKRTWQGFVTSVNVTGRDCGLRIPNLLMEALQVDVPVAALSKTCPHVLYDVNCRVVRASFALSVNWVVQNQNVLTVTSTGAPSNALWWNEGEVLHVASGERRTIKTRNGNDLTLEYPFPEQVVALAGSVTLYAGCDHSYTGINGCNPKFANRKNFGGHPLLQASNPWATSLTAAKDAL